MDITKQEQEIAEIEMANFVLLSLYRNYSLQMMNNSSLKDECITKMRQIKHDLRYLSRKELISKVKTIYKPLLHNQGN